MIFTDEQQLFRQSVREFAEKELAPLVPQIIETNMLPDGLYERAAELGILTVNIPEEYGGVGLGQVETCIVFEELCRVCPGFALSIEQTIDSNNLLLQSEAITKKYLSRLVDGTLRLGSGATPPEGQANTSEWKVAFKRTVGGYIANATRLYGTNADADLLNIYGLDEEGNVLVAFIESDWPGVSVLPLDKKLGQAGNHGGTMIIKDVFVPEENVTPSSVGDSLTYYTVYDCCAAEALGCAEGLFDKTVEFCKTRTHDYKPLVEMTAVSYKLAELKSKLYMASSMVYDCAQHQDEYMKTQDEVLKHTWFELAESTKMRVGELLMDVSYECIKLHGGLSYHDPNLWRYLGDQLNYCIMDQTTEIHLGALSRLMGIVK